MADQEEYSNASLEESLASTEASLNSMFESNKKTQTMRQKLLDIVVDVVDNYDFKRLKGGSKDDPKIFESHVKLIGEARMLLKDISDIDHKEVSVIQKKNMLETEQKKTANTSYIVEKLLEMDMKGRGFADAPRIPLSQSELDDIVEKQFVDRGCVVVEGESDFGGHQLPPPIVKEEDD